MDLENPELRYILLVEDDPMDVEMTLAALRNRHLANPVVVVNDGEEALDYFYKRGKYENRPGGQPLVILLDNKMPKVSGLEVLKVIKSDPTLKLIPVVALTSSREPSDLVAFYKNGVNAYVVKPVDFADFVEAVRQLGVFWGVVNEVPQMAFRERKLEPTAPSATSS